MMRGMTVFAMAHPEKRGPPTPARWLALSVLAAFPLFLLFAPLLLLLALLSPFICAAYGVEALVRPQARRERGLHDRWDGQS